MRSPEMKPPLFISLAKMPVRRYELALPATALTLLQLSVCMRTRVRVRFAQATCGNCLLCGTTCNTTQPLRILLRLLQGLRSVCRPRRCCARDLGSVTLCRGCRRHCNAVKKCSRYSYLSHCCRDGGTPAVSATAVISTKVRD